MTTRKSGMRIPVVPFVILFLAISMAIIHKSGETPEEAPPPEQTSFFGGGRDVSANRGSGTDWTIVFITAISSTSLAFYGAFTSPVLWREYGKLMTKRNRTKAARERSQAKSQQVVGRIPQLPPPNRGDY